MMHIMTQDGWRPFYDPAPVWEERRRQLAIARQRLADFDSEYRMRDVAKRGSLNAARNNLCRRLSRAQDGMVGGA